MIYKIAEALVEAEPRYDRMRRALERFSCEESGRGADFRIFATEGAVSQVIELNPALSRETAEEIILTNAFSRAIATRGGVTLHASAIKLDGRGYLFAADSKVGKSTHRALWTRRFGADRVKILNDDRPAIRCDGATPVVYGTPFSGGSELFENDSAPIEAVYFLKRGEKSSATRIYGSRIVEGFMSNTLKFVGAEHMTLLMDIIDRLGKSVSFFELICTPDDSALDCALNTINYK